MDWISVGLFLVMAAWAVLFVVALVQIVRSPQLSETNRLLWIVIALFAPVIGPVIWFFAGRTRVPR